MPYFENTLTCQYLPPTMLEHWNTDTPTQYAYFWIIGGVSVLITAILIIPRWFEFLKFGDKMREQQGLILTPLSATAYSLIVIYPLIASLLKYWTFISPISSFTSEFLLHGFEGIVLFLFGKILIMYLGSIENSMEALKEAHPTKFYAVPPFGCCLKPCIAATNMNHKDFRRLHYLILQFAILTPIFSYLLLLSSFQAQTVTLWLLTIFDVISSMLCVYALFALMTAAHSILSQHKIHHKFWCIKGLVMVMLIPNLMLRFIDPSYYGTIPGVNVMYSDHVMVEAYGSFAEIILFAFSAIFFRKYFHTDDALYAHTNHTFKSHNVRYSQVDVVMHDVPQQTDVDEVEPVCNETNELKQSDIKDVKSLSYAITM